jgi:ATP phosphoribosyltransferase regulatory subunit
LIGLRRPSEILKRLNDKAADWKERPLPRETILAIEDYLRLRASIPSALGAMEKLFRGHKINLDHRLAELQSLFGELQRLAGNTPLKFSADFGRHFEYYTGMVFQLEIEGAGAAGEIAGGGRYDGLIRALSAGARDTPAIGAAIHTERLLAAASRR